MAADLDAQAVAIEKVLLHRKSCKAFLTCKAYLSSVDAEALQNAAQTLRRMKSLALRVEQEAITPQGTSEELTEELTEELICILRLPRS